MDKRNTTNKLLFFFLKGTVKVFSILPLPLVQFCSTTFARILNHLIKYRKETVEKNLANSFPQKSAQERQHISKQFYLHLSDLLFETLKGVSWSQNTLKAHFQIKNPSIFTAHLKEGRSCLLMGSHFNNWELGCMVFPLLVDCPVYTVYKPLSNPYLDKYINQLRSQWGMNMVPMKQLGRTIIEQKQQAAIYILLGDQGPATTDQAIWKNFLYQQTPFIHGIEKVAKKMNYPVFHFAIEKKQRGYYQAVFSGICSAPDNLEFGQLTEAYIDQLQASIRAQPAYWLWSHKRWKRANTGEYGEFRS